MYSTHTLRLVTLHQHTTTFIDLHDTIDDTSITNTILNMRYEHKYNQVNCGRFLNSTNPVVDN